MSRRKFATLAPALLLITMAGSMQAGEWTQSTFKDFAGGQFLDGGSNLYVSAKGRMQIINRWDMNGDGHLDVIMPSGHAHTEKEDTYIYLNNGSDIDGRLQIRLPANGSREGLIHDFNKDGFNDIAVCNADNGIHTHTNSYIYYGSKDGFSAAAGRRTTLPSYTANSIAAGDVNGDGWTDVAIAAQWQAGDPVEPKGPMLSLVYYNGPEGFKPERRTEVSFGEKTASAVAAADLDGDSKSDLVFSAGGKLVFFYSAKNAIENESARVELPIGASSIAIGNVTGDAKPDLILCSREEVTVIIGSAAGFKPEENVKLQAKGPSGVAVADFDGDGMNDIAIANGSGADGAAWVNSYVYFGDGKDFSSRKRIELPTMGASAVSAGDLDGDKRPEIVISNQHVNNQNAIPSLVFWNRNGTFTNSARTELETQGTVSNAVGDLNHDGKGDVVFFNYEGNFRDGASFSSIFFGDGTRNYTLERCVEIPTHYITSTAHADLDDDGKMDLVLTQSRFINGSREDIFNSVIICWGEDPTYRKRTRLTVDYLAGGTRIMDLNRDGHLDLIVGAFCYEGDAPEKRKKGEPRSEQKQSKGLPVFWGSANGYSQTNRSLIMPVGEYPRAPLLADVNRDGFVDMVSQAEFGIVEFWYGTEKGLPLQSSAQLKMDRADELVFIDSADLNKDGFIDLILPNRKLGKNAEVSSFVYYGSANGYSNDRREELLSKGSYEFSAADLDKDGWLDLFFTSYKGNFKRNFPSTIHWGSSQGFKQRPATEIPTLAASGIETADYDGDGWIDLLISNHRSDGSSDEPGPHNHKTNSMLYWGGKDGFSPKQRWDFITNGPHAMNVRDVGNGVDRGLYEDYVSEAHQASEQTATSLKWKAETPHGTSVKFQVRTAASKEELQRAVWQGPKGPDSWYAESDSKLENVRGAWIQYRARLITPNGGPTPYLSSVTIQFAP